MYSLVLVLYKRPTLEIMHKLLVALPLLAAVASAQYLIPTVAAPWTNQIINSLPVVQHSLVSQPYIINPTVAVPTSSQYHAQDELGQFAFGHSSINQAREEVKSLDGTVRGAYSYVDPQGKLINVQYLADSNGFRVLGANNLPVAPEAKLEPVKDTAEVVAARAEFARAFKEAEKASSETAEVPKEEEAKSRKRRQALWSPLLAPSIVSPLLAPTVAVSPVLAKSKVTTTELKTVDDAKVPANTKLAEIKEKEHEILTPLTYSLPLAHSVPLVTPNGIFHSNPLFTTVL